MPSSLPSASQSGRMWLVSRNRSWERISSEKRFQLIIADVGPPQVAAVKPLVYAVTDRVGPLEKRRRRRSARLQAFGLSDQPADFSHATVGARVSRARGNQRPARAGPWRCRPKSSAWRRERPADCRAAECAAPGPARVTARSGPLGSVIDPFVLSGQLQKQARPVAGA